MTRTEKIILGIDPGTNVMGYGLIRAVGNKAELMAMGVIDMRKDGDPYLRLGKIFEQVTEIIDQYLPDEMAIEAPFFGKNVQSMLKLGRSQGVAIAAAVHHSVPIHEYAPMKIKMAITGQGQASETAAAHPAGKNAPTHGRNRRTGRGILPLHAGRSTDRGSEIPRMEGLHKQEPEPAEPISRIMTTAIRTT